MWRRLRDRRRRRGAREGVVGEAERIVAEAIPIAPVPGNVSVLRAFPISRYQELRNGEISVDTFADELIAFVDAELALAWQFAP